MITMALMRSKTTQRGLVILTYRTERVLMRFKALLLLSGKTATGIEIPATVIEELGAGKKPPVLVTLNGHTYRSTVASRGGRYLVGVSAENREAAGVSAGETLTVDIEIDAEPREVPVPAELGAALGAHPDAKAAFQALSPSKKQQLTLPIERAKTDETRRRNLKKALDALQESVHGKRRQSGEAQK